MTGKLGFYRVVCHCQLTNTEAVRERNRLTYRLFSSLFCEVLKFRRVETFVEVGIFGKAISLVNNRNSREVMKS